MQKLQKLQKLHLCQNIFFTTLAHAQIQIEKSISLQTKELHP